MPRLRTIFLPFALPMPQNTEMAPAATRPIPPSIVRGRPAALRGADVEVDGEEDGVEPPFSLAFMSRLVSTSLRERVTVVVIVLVTVTHTDWNARRLVDGYRLL